MIFEQMAWYIQFLIAVARMELRGIPFDIQSYRKIKKVWPSIRAGLIEAVNSNYHVYVNGSFNKRTFLRWCRLNNINWPVKQSETTGKPFYPLDDDTMESMETFHPFIKTIRQVRKTLNSLSNRSLVVDDALYRHFFSTSVFRSVTGRNQPKNFVFSGPKWLRFLIVPESLRHVLVYVDFTAQEIGIAAALSGDPVMREIYLSSDCHMAFAIRAGAAPVGATKKTHSEIRKRYKTVNLGVLYGQTEIGIAARLGISREEARALLADHKRLFPVFWAWTERTVQGAFDRGFISTQCGWRSRVQISSNERTWMNFPMQATGGDIMRLVMVFLDRQNVRIMAPVHDGFLLSCRNDQIEDLRQAVDFAFVRAVEHVLPGFPLKWDFTEYATRFEDDDGLEIWKLLQSILAKVDA